MLTESGVTNHEIKALANGEIKVTLNSSNDYRKCRNLFDEVQNNPGDAKKSSVGLLEYHTYRLPEDKPFTVFVRGLHYSTEVKDIISELDKAGHTAINVINVQIRKRIDNKPTIIKLPLFKIDLKKQVNNRTIFDLEYLVHCRIKVEMPRKTTSLPQCKRCQDYGHSANYCTRTPKCVKCGESHFAAECKLKKTNPPCCANCKEQHTANYKGCSYYKSKVQPAKKTKTAVERLNENHNAPIHSHVGNSYSTYAESARKNSNLTMNTTPVESSQGGTETAKILEILQRLERAQATVNEKISSIEKRILELESSKVDTPSPPRKQQRKS